MVTYKQPRASVETAETKEKHRGAEDAPTKMIERKMSTLTFSCANALFLGHEKNASVRTEEVLEYKRKLNRIPPAWRNNTL